MGSLDRAMAKSLQRKLIDGVAFDQESADEVERAFSLENLGFDSVKRRKDSVMTERAKLRSCEPLKKSKTDQGDDSPGTGEALRQRVAELEEQNKKLIRDRAGLRSMLEKAKSSPAPRKAPRDDVIEDGKKILLALESMIVTREELQTVLDANAGLTPDQRRSKMIEYIDGKAKA